MALCLAAAQLNAGDPLLQRRRQLDETFSRHLGRIEAKCRELELSTPAQLTAQWFQRPDPARLYFSLGPSEHELQLAATASQRERQWFDSCRHARRTYARHLWKLALDAAAAGRGGLALRTLFDIAREDPDHEPTHTILQLPSRTANLRGDQWQLARPRVKHPQVGWAAGEYWIVESAHFRLETDAARDVAQRLVRELEEMHTVWCQLFFDVWSSPDSLSAALRQQRSFELPTQRHRVVLFAQRAQYVRVLKPFEPQIEITLGIYRHSDRAAYFYQAGPDAYATRIHEVTHQLFHEIAAADDTVGQQANFWLVEGIALYMESLRQRRGVAQLGGVDAERLQYARYRAKMEGFHIPLADLMRLGRLQLQAHDNIREIYSEAAGLTQFLMHQEHQGRTLLIAQLRGLYGLPITALPPDDADGAGQSGHDVVVGEAQGQHVEAQGQHVEAQGQHGEAQGQRGEAQGQRERQHAELLGWGQSLTEIDQAYFQFLDVTDEALQHVDPETTKLALGRTSITDRGLQRLARLKRLSWIDLSCCPITDRGLEHLAHLQGLRQLGLQQTQITDAALSWVGAWTELRELDLSQTSVTSAGLMQLTDLDKLESLWLNGTNVDDAIVPLLIRFTSLRTLDLSATAISPEAEQRLRQALPGVRLLRSDP